MSDINKVQENKTRHKLCNFIAASIVAVEAMHACGTRGEFFDPEKARMVYLAVAVLLYSENGKSNFGRLLDAADKIPVRVRAKRIKKAQDKKMKKAFQHASANIVKEGMERACKVAEEMAENNPNSYRAKETLESNNANVAPILEAGILGKGGR